MKAPKRIQVSFSTGDDWPVPIRESVIQAQMPVKRVKWGRRETCATGELADRLVLLLLHRCRSVA